MLIGTYYHHLEVKGRVSLPRAFRSMSAEWIVTRGLDSCIYVIPQSSFDTELKALQTSPFASKDQRSLLRLVANDAQSLEADGIGRIHLPSHLIAHAQLQKEVVLVGSISRVEIWNRDIYHTYIETVSPKFESLVEQMYQGEVSHD